jgi:hypothetical protein
LLKVVLNTKTPNPNQRQIYLSAEFNW